MSFTLGLDRDLSKDIEYSGWLRAVPASIASMNRDSVSPSRHRPLEATDIGIDSHLNEGEAAELAYVTSRLNVSPSPMRLISYSSLDDLAVFSRSTHERIVITLLLLCRVTTSRGRGFDQRGVIGVHRRFPSLVCHCTAVPPSTHARTAPTRNRGGGEALRSSQPQGVRPAHDVTRPATSPIRIRGGSVRVGPAR